MSPICAPENFDAVEYINDPSWHSSVYGLERIRDLLERMGCPQDRLRFVHVAGTNGKGSTCAYVNSILIEAGYRTGLFTSPYLIRFEERIRVSGQMISSVDLREVTLFVREHAEAIAAETGEHPTEFELMTAVALEHFARSGCDIAVLEVGLGGLLDSTNAIDAPEVCAITRIGLDHTALLGTTHGEIARQKAGIIKPGATVISYPQDADEATDTIADAARQAGCRLVTPDFGALQVGGVSGGVRAFRYAGEDFITRLLGTYQPGNAAMAIEIARALRERGWSISDDAIRNGVAHAAWEGRFEVVEAGCDGLTTAAGGSSASAATGEEVAMGVSGDDAAADHRPTIVVDGGHNPQGAAVLADSLSSLFPGDKILFVMSVLADKDYAAMIDCVLPLAGGFVCVTPPNPRALSADELARAIETAAESVNADLPWGVRRADGFTQAIRLARAVEGANAICAFGSLYSIADIKEAIANTAMA